MFTVWLINTGWTGGALRNRRKWELYTRAMITAALNSELDHVEYQNIKVELQFRNLVQMCQSI
jgi:phosphoenolpyruvate carboxykinase (ATP)